jgi:hypothetical protein
MTHLLHTLLIGIRKMTNRMPHQGGRSVVIGALVLQLAGSPAFGSVSGGRPFPNIKGLFDNPAVVPVRPQPFEALYEELAAKFWQWQFSMPVNANPVFDTADCSTNQSGLVWFLAGSGAPFEVSPGVVQSVAHRNCKMPWGKALFVPVINAECSTIPGDQLPPYGPTLEELKPCSQFAAGFIDRSKLIATLDGVPIKALPKYQVTSPMFTFGPLPHNNQFESYGLVAPAGTTGQAVSTGIHLLFYPLSPGRHTIFVHSEVDVTPIGGPRLIFETTFHLMVER